MFASKILHVFLKFQSNLMLPLWVMCFQLLYWDFWITTSSLYNFGYYFTKQVDLHLQEIFSTQKLMHIEPSTGIYVYIYIYRKHLFWRKWGWGCGSQNAPFKNNSWDLKETGRVCYIYLTILWSYLNIL